MFPSKKKKCFVLTQNHEDAFHASLQALGFISLIAKDKNEDLKQMRYFIYFFFFETIKRGNAGGFRQMRRCLRNIFIFFFGLYGPRCNSGFISCNNLKFQLTPFDKTKIFDIYIFVLAMPLLLKRVLKPPHPDLCRQYPIMRSVSS